MTISSIRSALSPVPVIFSEALVSEYEESQNAALRGDWEKVGLKAGKICEIAYCVLEGVCTGSYPSAPSKPRDMQAACRALENQTGTNASRSARVQIPRVIAATYELRNNRAIGHAGGDVSPNQMDGLFFNQSIKWILCELIRLFMPMSVDETSLLVDGISIRWSPAIWQSDDKKRLLIQGLDIKDKVVGLLYFSELRCSVDQLRKWLSIKNITHFKNRTLVPLDIANIIHFDTGSGIIDLLPPGIRSFEDRYLKR